jgi:hypothetical protein
VSEAADSPSPADGLSPEEMVRRVRRLGFRLSLEQMTHLLDEFRADGLAEETCMGRWRLTAEAEQRFGQALREMRPRA